MCNSNEIGHYDKIRALYNSQILTDVELRRIDNVASGIAKLDNDPPTIYDCAVFDLDDTLFYSCSQTILPATKYLYDYVLNTGIPIFIITARKPIAKEATLLQLRSHRLDYKDLFMFNASSEHQVELKKYYARKHIEKLGYNIWLCVGDDPGDFYGGCFKYSIKIAS